MNKLLERAELYLLTETEMRETHKFSRLAPNWLFYLFLESVGGEKF